jgi:glucan phosphorylase
MSIAAQSPQSVAPVAYFCAEYGFDANLPIYAGGLGILAGDTVKEAADQAADFVAVGLLHRGYGMKQSLSEDGLQQDEDWHFDPLSVGLEHVYVDEMPLFVKVHLTEVDVWLRCWKKTFANGVVLYLLDSDTDQNQLNERDLTKVLYSGTQETQVKQQLLLGIGGVKLLTALGLHPRLYHLNEGRPAFLHWQVIRQLMDTHRIGYESARKLAREKTVYTNHTLVAAGNQGYSMNILRAYSQYYADKMGVTTDRLLATGIDSDPEVFSMTRFALNVSHRASGVSALHTSLSKDQWPEYNWNNITNGVHLPTWQDQRIVQAGDDTQALWSAHQANKIELMEYVRAQTGYGYDPNRLVLSWARRIAGYKQLDRLFDDIERLRSILKNSARPVQLLVAGKAHQGDTQGKALLQQIIGHFQQELSGNALFIPNYNLDIARHLVRGSDVWLNTPVKGNEASGTSGMKAVSNGVLQCSVSDGWVCEFEWQDAGWVIQHDRVSEHLYELLEQEIAPLYFERNEHGIPERWVERMRRTIAFSDRVSSRRMFQEYTELLYS